jgi:predicted aspartyl protease
MQTPVQAFTTTYNARVNVLKSKVHISKAFNRSSFPIPPNPQDVAAIEFIAIWDTGATNSVITQKVIDGCGLKPIGMVNVHHANGESLTTVYFVSIFLPNKVIIPQLRVSRGIIAGDAEVLIGMDIIGQGDFAVTNKDGKTAFSFRTPSIECIDFVKQAQPGAAQQIPKPPPKVGRNDPCPCGSGKKYKKCCGK